MLEHIGEAKAGATLVAAFEAALAAGVRTRDLGGTASTDEFTEAVLSHCRLLASSTTGGVSQA
ncbi:MAG TPA: hypothetical protein VFP89_15225 [Propionibacteriaceae bacterium]|nr:hypothetical protein [Propionibacteriaceae bacterium]